jgi:curved DNA-binding protein CbpA
MSKDFYSILSVPRDAKPPQIKRRFIELARERHPDRFQGVEKVRAEEEFQSITEAFNVLMDPLQRRQHDLELAMPSHTGGRSDPGQLARVYLNRGIRAYKTNNLAEAADNFERATRAEPQNYQAWHHLALTCSREPRWLAKAQQAIERACELRPSHAPYFKLAGKIFALSKMTGRAKQYYNQALKLGGVDPAIHKALKALGQDVRGSTAERGAAEPGRRGETPGRFKKDG